MLSHRYSMKTFISVLSRIGTPCFMGGSSTQLHIPLPGAVAAASCPCKNLAPGAIASLPSLNLALLALLAGSVHGAQTAGQPVAGENAALTIQKDEPETSITTGANAGQNRNSQTAAGQPYPQLNGSRNNSGGGYSYGLQDI